MTLPSVSSITILRTCAQVWLVLDRNRRWCSDVQRFTLGHGRSGGLWQIARSVLSQRKTALNYGIFWSPISDTSQTHVFLLFYAVDNRTSFENAGLRWIPELRKNCPDTPIILVGKASSVLARCLRIDETISLFAGAKVDLRKEGTSAGNCVSTASIKLLLWIFKNQNSLLTGNVWRRIEACQEDRKVHRGICQDKRKFRRIIRGGSPAGDK